MSETYASVSDEFGHGDNVRDELIHEVIALRLQFASRAQLLAAARAEVEKLTRDRNGWERRTKEIGSVVIRAWALLRDWWQYAQLEEREEPFVDALTRALAADAEHDAYALAEIRRWRDMAGEAARLRGVLEEVREQLKYTGVSSALLPMVESALAAQEGV